MYDLRRLLRELDEQGFVVEERRTQRKHQWVVRKNGSQPVFIFANDLEHRSTAGKVIKKLVALGFTEPGTVKGGRVGTGEFVCCNCQERRALAELSRFSMNILTGKGNLDSVEDNQLICRFCQPKGVPRVIKDKTTKVEVRKVEPSPVENDRLVRYPEIAETLGVTEAYARALVSQGRLPKAVVAGMVGVRESDFLKYLDKRTKPDKVGRAQQASGAGAGPVSPERPPAPEPTPAPEPIVRVVEKKRPDPENLKDLSVYVYDYRKRNNLAQHELAELVGVTQTIISKVEIGRRINAEKLEALGTYFGFSKKTVDHLSELSPRRGRPLHRRQEAKVEPVETSTSVPSAPRVAGVELDEKSRKALDFICSVTGESPDEVVRDILSTHLKERLRRVVDEM